MTKAEVVGPSISADGQRISYVLRDFEYAPNTRDHWRPTRERLMIADISGDHTRGGTLVTVDPTAGGIWGQSIDGTGQRVAFYACDAVTSPEVANLRMPPPSGNIYCFVVTDLGGGREDLHVAPHPQDASRPLPVVENNPVNAHQIQSFTTSNVLSSPPSISANGRRVAFTAGLTDGASTTGVYVFEPDRSTHVVIHFDGEPWAGPGEQTLNTGVAPSLSADGAYVAYQRRIVTFPEWPEPHDPSDDGTTYCPAVLSDDVIVQELPRGDTSLMIEAEPNPVPAPYNSSFGVACANNGQQVAFIATCDKEGRNPDYHAQVFYGVRRDA